MKEPEYMKYMYLETATSTRVKKKDLARKSCFSGLVLKHSTIENKKIQKNNTCNTFVLFTIIVK